MGPRIGSLANPADVKDAIDEILGGGFVATQYHGVFIIVFSASYSETRKRVLATKGETDAGKPLTSMTFCKFVFPYVDLNRVPSLTVRDLIGDGERYGRALGAMCHIRLPLQQEAVKGPIPSSLISVVDGLPSAQCLDPYGNVLFSSLVHGLNEAGLDFVTASSLNRSGESEICEISIARDFCDENGIPFLLRDPLFSAREVRGSFPIIDLERMTAIRDGHIPLPIIERIVGWEVDKSHMRPAKYPHAAHLRALLERQELQGSALRREVLNHLYGAG